MAIYAERVRDLIMPLQQMSKGKVARMAEDARNSDIKLAFAELKTREQFVSEIRTLWADAQERFILIGRYLIQAKQRLPHGEYTDMIEDELPFGPQVAFQLARVATAIEEGKLAIEELPRSYATAYHLTTLTDEELERARKANIVRPDVKRREIVAFKQQVRARAGQNEQREALIRQREKLVAERERINAEIQRLNDLLGEDVLYLEAVNAES
jgi:hypothetical protein